MGLGSFLGRFLGRADESASKSAAKDRLRLVLMHDRTDIPATMMEAIRSEMMAVLSKYVEIDNDALDVQLEREAGSIGLVLNIPIRRVKTEAEASEALAVMHAVQTTGTAPVTPANDGQNVPHSEEPSSEPAPTESAAPESTAVNDIAEENAGEPEKDTPSISNEEARPTPSPSPRATASIPVRALGYAKNNAESNIVGITAQQESANSGKPTSADAEPRTLVRDAWYSAELLQVVNAERQEAND